MAVTLRTPLTTFHSSRTSGSGDNSGVGVGSAAVAVGRVDVPALDWMAWPQPASTRLARTRARRERWDMERAPPHRRAGLAIRSARRVGDRGRVARLSVPPRPLCGRVKVAYSALPS